MKKATIMPCLFLGILGCAPKPNAQKIASTSATDNGSYWLTDLGDSIMFQQRSLVKDITDRSATTITIDPSTTYQTVDGFGYTLTGGSAEHLNNMSTSARQAFLTEVFDSSKGIGVSYLRISVGASDLDSLPFSYDDLPSGVSTDNELQYFSIQKDQHTLIPILKQILLINPHIKILGSPWSPPAWMKDNHNTKGGKLKTDCYDVYARYFVKYIEAMKTNGINIDAITVQNEPLNPKNNPSLDMQPEEQLAFVKTALGPAFQAHNIKTKIILYDHNADRPDYPITVLNDPNAAKYVDGSAFHLYGGKIDAIGTVHEKFPQKNLYFTEQWTGAQETFANNLSWHTENVIIGSMRNWCKTALEWNISSNPTLTPHTPGGCDQCLGAVTIDGDSITRNAGYYIVAHASKLARPGSVRIASNMVDNLPNVAFQRPDGKIALIVMNKDSKPSTFNIALDNKTFSMKINGNSIESILL
ncbi:MAG: glycoside hydrolase family 30 beta sandwich domain-containing protein [Chitinophagaceae bacterium]